ncbi:hypothetical protein O9993_09325 [Vibrio lentus]|nr:hypothetical protein [Vibrio lentus]
MLSNIKCWLDETAQQLIRQRLEAVFNDAALPTQWIASDNYQMGSELDINKCYRLAVVKIQQDLLSTLASLRDFGVSKRILLANSTTTKTCWITSSMTGINGQR